MTWLLLAVVFRVILWYCVWNLLVLFQDRYLRGIPVGRLVIGYVSVATFVVGISLVLNRVCQSPF